MLLPAGATARAGPSGAPSPSLAAAIDHVHSQQPFTGSVLAVTDRRIVAARAYGYANRARHVRATLRTRYRISDLTGAFTWIGLLQQSDRHRLDLDRSVCALVRPCPRAWRQLTPRHLMGGGSGLRSVPQSAFGHTPPTLAQYVERLRREPLNYRPGTRVAHYGSTYFSGVSPIALAARLLELASREAWTTYVRRHIMRPAGMTSTGFGRSPRDSVGYGRGRDGALVPRPAPRPTLVPSVDLGLWSTVLDFLRLHRALSSGRLLSRASLAELDRPVLASDRRRGRGPSCCWIVTKLFGHDAEVDGGHGFGDGFYAVFERFPADGAAVFAFTNSGGNGPAFSVADLAASVVLDEYPSEVAVDPDTLRRDAGTFAYVERRAGRTFRIRVTFGVTGNQLRVTRASTGWESLRSPLLATSETTFVAKYAPALTFQFRDEVAGRPSTAVLREINSGWRWELHRVG